MKILYFSSVNWEWIKQRPHFIAMELCKEGYYVDFLSLNPLGKRKLQIHNDKTAKDINKLTIYDKVVLPFSSKLTLVENLNVSYIQKILTKNDYDCIVVTSPQLNKYIPQKYYDEKRVVYECMDNFAYFFRGKRRNKVVAEEQRLLAKVNTVISSSNYLTDRLINEFNYDKEEIKTIYNAVDKEMFEKVNYNLIDIPVQKLNNPNAVYIGTVAEWLDWETLTNFAENNLDITIYLIGPIVYKPEIIPNNIKLLGPISHTLVLSYIKSGNILLLPFKVDELTKGVDPVKMYEYLSLNKKILSTYWDELRKFETNNIEYYYSVNDFEVKFKKILNDVDHTQVDVDFIARNNWQVRCQEYIEEIKKTVRKEGSNYEY